MKLNQRGEMFTLAVVALVGVVSLLVGLTFSPIKKVLGFGSEGSKSKQSYVSKTESKPIAVKGQDGKTYWLEQTKAETRTMDENEQPKMSLLQKIFALPKLWVILMILGIFFPPIAGIMAFVNGKLGLAAKQMVLGIENGIKEIKDEDTKKGVLNALSKKYDEATKTLVKKIKAKLPNE